MERRSSICPYLVHPARHARSHWRLRSVLRAPVLVRGNVARHLILDPGQLLAKLYFLGLVLGIQQNTSDSISQSIAEVIDQTLPRRLHHVLERRRHAIAAHQQWDRFSELRSAPVQPIGLQDEEVLRVQYRIDLHPSGDAVVVAARHWRQSCSLQQIRNFLRDGSVAAYAIEPLPRKVNALDGPQETSIVAILIFDARDRGDQRGRLLLWCFLFEVDFPEHHVHDLRLRAFPARFQRCLRHEDDRGVVTEAIVPADPHRLPRFEDEIARWPDVALIVPVVEVLTSRRIEPSVANAITQWRLLERVDVRLVLKKNRVVFNRGVDIAVVGRVVFLRIHSGARLLVDEDFLDPAPAHAHRVGCCTHACHNSRHSRSVAAFHRVVDRVREFAQLFEANERILRRQILADVLLRFARGEIKFALLPSTHLLAVEWTHYRLEGNSVVERNELRWEENDVVALVERAFFLRATLVQTLRNIGVELVDHRALQIRHRLPEVDRVDARVLLTHHARFHQQRL